MDFGNGKGLTAPTAQRNPGDESEPARRRPPKTSARNDRAANGTDKQPASIAATDAS